MDASDPRRVAERMESVLEDLEQYPDPRARALAEEAVRRVSALYGVGLERIVERLAAASGGERALRALLEEPLVASLLALHDLHPDPADVRIARALARAGDAAGDGSAGELFRLERIEDGVAHVRVAARRPSAATLARAVEQAIAAEVPDVAVRFTGLEPAPDLVTIQPLGGPR